MAPAPPCAQLAPVTARERVGVLCAAEGGVGEACGVWQVKTEDRAGTQTECGLKKEFGIRI
eukprot:scaffold28131_cov101-Isochrysis_galbana.AAC.2